MTTAVTPLTDHLSMRPGISFETTGPGRLEVVFRQRPILRVTGITDTLAERLSHLTGGADTDVLNDPLLHAEFERLTAPVRRCVVYAASSDGQLLAVSESLRTDLDRVPPVPLRDDDLVRQSKFAYTHTQDGELLFESPAAGARVIAVDDRVAALVARTARAGTVAEVIDAARDLPATAARDVLELLYGTGFLEVSTEAGDPSSFPSDNNPVLRQWDFHDLLFHARSRFGRTTEPFGGIFPYVDQIDPQPPVRRRHEGPVIDLPRPQFEEVLREDPPVLLAMETRHSVRTFGEQPLTLEQLGEFLFRTCRIKEIYGPLPNMPYAATKRPYPTGGAAYELEIYLTVRRVTGLEPGCYHYEADLHRLRRLPTSAADQADLLMAASVSAGGDVHPDVLLTMTSRFQRLQWKYRSIAYAVSLKHAGVLYQTFYLVASAMKIGACGLGSGNSQTSVKAFGLDYLEESSIGEFIIGSAPQESRSAGAIPQVALGEERWPGQHWGVQAAWRRS